MNEVVGKNGPEPVSAKSLALGALHAWSQSDARAVQDIMTILAVMGVRGGSLMADTKANTVTVTFPLQLDTKGRYSNWQRDDV